MIWRSLLFNDCDDCGKTDGSGGRSKSGSRSGQLATDDELRVSPYEQSLQPSAAWNSWFMKCEESRSWVTHYSLERVVQVSPLRRRTAFEVG